MNDLGSVRLIYPQIAMIAIPAVALLFFELKNSFLIGFCYAALLFGVVSLTYTRPIRSLKENQKLIETERPKWIRWFHQNLVVITVGTGLVLSFII